MTNKEKYPNAKVEKNECCNLYGGYYIRLSQGMFLKRDGSADSHSYSNPSNTYFESREIAQSALDKFMNENKEVTLNEIKSQLAEAKKLIGKKIKRIGGNDTGLVHEVDSVSLEIDGYDGRGTFSKKFFDENGYIIFLCSKNRCYETAYAEGSYSVVKQVVVENIHDEKYTAEDAGYCWKFGCAEISKELIKKLCKIMSSKQLGNRQATKVTIGAADFDLDTLKALVDLEK